MAGNLKISGSGEGDTLGNLEGTGVDNKLGIYDGEVLGITLRVAYRNKIGKKNYQSKSYQVARLRVFNL